MHELQWSEFAEENIREFLDYAGLSLATETFDFPELLEWLEAKKLDCGVMIDFAKYRKPEGLGRTKQGQENKLVLEGMKI